MFKFGGLVQNLLHSKEAVTEHILPTGDALQCSNLRKQCHSYWACVTIECRPKDSVKTWQ